MVVGAFWTGGASALPALVVVKRHVDKINSGVPVSANETLVTCGAALIGANDHTWDCWKPILHNQSIEPSKGMSLNDMIANPLVTNLECYDHHFILRNIWNERFRIDQVILSSGELALHATIIN